MKENEAAFIAVGTRALRILTKEDLETLTSIFSKSTVLQPIVRMISSYANRIMRFIS